MTISSRKGFLSVLMVLVMALSLLPTAAFAATADTQDAPGAYVGKNFEDKNDIFTVTPLQQGTNSVFPSVDATLGFAGGTGTQEDPYLISGEAGLRYLQTQVAAGNTYADQYIKLTADIQLTEEWTPIGSGKNVLFSGTFDGDGYTVSDMTITDNSLSYAGLFGYVGKGGSVKNVKLTNVKIDVKNESALVYAGALIAMMENDSSGNHISVVDNCSAIGTIRVTTANKTAIVGGLIGLSNQYAAITNSGTNVTVTVDSGSSIATVGGFIGMPSVKPLLMNNYSLGNVSVTSGNGNSNVGAMFGQLNGIVYNCYTGGSATGSSGNVGGFAGKLSSAYADSCYSIGSTAFGSIGVGSYNNETVISKTAEEIKSEAFAQLLHDNLSSSALDTMASNVTNANVANCTNFSDLMARNNNRFQDWTLSNGVVLLTGTLWIGGTVDTSVFAGGTGTEIDPYMIKTEKQLRAFANSLSDELDYTNEYIRLGNDITLTDGDWEPIGGSDYAFNGTFDGAGHTISGMKLGTAAAPYEMDSEHIYFGLFGVLNSNAVVKNVNLTDLAFYTNYGGSGLVGGIAGYMAGSTVADSYDGALIDSCSVIGTISHTGAKGNQFVAGLVGWQYKGAIINSYTKVNATCIVTSGSLAEVGGLVALNNRGLVANCWSDSVIYGSGSRENGAEGMAVASPLVACNGGALANCYASGKITTGEHCVYAGLVSGWVTGIGKSYTCWYDLGSTMIINNGEPLNPVASIGTLVPSGVDDEGGAYTGGVIDKIVGYTSAEYSNLHTNLNSTFSEFPIDIVGLYHLDAKALKNWSCKNGVVTFDDTYGNVTYVQPEAEKYTPLALTLQDGTWYGRDDEKTTVVKIIVKAGVVTETAVLSGETSGDAYNEAVEKAEYKATYGDTTNYDAVDPTRFAGGTGTVEDPYLVADEAQLRYIAQAINADVNWNGVYFRQTADITLSDDDWLPIGWSIIGEVNGAGTTICVYPFRGNYDGANYTISGLTIGSEDSPSNQTTFGLFGLTSGSYVGNEIPTGEEQVVELKNIHLQDVDIHISTRYQNYIGGLVGSAQNGIYIDNCSVTGEIDVVSTEGIARAGGLVANILRGAVTNSWTDVSVAAKSETSHVYGGGLYGGDNRVTTVNCYTLGNVTGDAGNNNKVHIGGIAGQGGGIHVNCYSLGDVISYQTTSDVGLLNGRAAGICVEYNCYYNTEAVLKQGNTVVSPVVANGVAVNRYTSENIVGKTAAELGDQSFADLLNGNITADSMTAVLEAVNAAIDRDDLVQQNYYQGNALNTWVAEEGVVAFGTISDDETPNPEWTDCPFDDIGHGTDQPHWAYDDIRYAYENGLMNGMGNRLFVPEGTSTRAMVVTVLYRMETGELDKAYDGAIKFNDLKAGEWYTNAMIWATENGILKGYGDGTCLPDNEITREELACFMQRYAAYKGLDVTASASLSNFSDGETVSDWAEDAVSWAVAVELMEGHDTGILEPQGNATRAQLSAIFHRFCDMF